MNVFVFGGRDFSDYNLLESTLDNLLKDITESITIIEGDAKGADELSGKYANEKGYNIKHFPAKWNDLEKLLEPRYLPREVKRNLCSIVA